jgi:hypothetical protein
MELLILLVIFIGGPIGGGITLLWLGLRRPDRHPASRPPEARVVTGDHSDIGRGRGARTAARTVAVIGGTALIGGGVAILAAVIDFMQNGLGGGSKGRILRLRGKAALPELAADDGWSDDARPAIDGVSDDERRVIAACWILSAQMEHASVAAFAQLSLHLAALGAPAELVERTHRAALDEIRHARRCFALAGAFAGTPVGAGPIAALAQPAAADRAPIDLVRLAVGSLVDGALAEGIAADVARRAGDAARDPVVRLTFAMIAADEETHAELAWSILAWCVDRGGDPVRAAVHARALRLGDELAPPAPDLGGIDPGRLAGHGLLTSDAIGAIAAARIAAVRERALACSQPMRRVADGTTVRQRASSAGSGLSSPAR